MGFSHKLPGSTLSDRWNLKGDREKKRGEIPLTTASCTQDFKSAFSVPPDKKSELAMIRPVHFSE